MPAVLDLKGKISERSAAVGILGLGYVGLPLAMEFASKGFRVVGFEIDKERAAALSRGFSHVPDVPARLLRDHLKSGRFRATQDFAYIAHCDALIICVPTPLRKSKEPDVSFILSACRQVAAHLRRGQLVVLESTTYPGTTEELMLPLLERRGERRGAGGSRLKAGRDFYLAFSPERVDPANPAYRISNTPKIVGGMTARCRELACLLYGQIVSKVVPVSSVRAAEMAKLLENTFRSVNIGLVNEIALMCNRLGLDVWEIISAAATKPFGFMPFYPGPGIGGHCIPVDPSYLSWKMKELNFEARFIELATVINGHMPEYAVRRISDILNDAGKPLKGSRVLVLGASYKPEVSDIRESPSLDVMKLLIDRGARVSYHDPFVPALRADGIRLHSRPLASAELKGADVVAILTAHRAVDYARVLREARLVFDARNATAGMARGNLFRL